MSDNGKTITVNRANGGEVSAGARAMRSVTPRADIYESSSSGVLLIELPGVLESSVEVRYEKGLLLVSASDAVPAQAGGLHHREFGDCVYKRAFRVAETLDPEGIKAELKNGLLTVTCPKSERARERKIPVQVAS